MGSNMKPTIFSDRVATALRKWHETARKHLKENQRPSSVTSLSTSRPATPAHGLSPVHLLRRYRSDVDSLQASPRRYTIDDEQYDLEGTPSPSHHTISGSPLHHMQQGQLDGGREMQELGHISAQQLPQDIESTQGASISIDFSFDKRQR
ncbi:putative MLO-like protein 6 [Cocos nucifera]|uniref:Putative MLO-like protein 6 n=1 Tax=Cocos nucifera TaxID=13894 RepID=A0A8K0IFR6_COCNU|nr:putative MLO-like protein 6 [Cocos nucifera]